MFIYNNKALTIKEENLTAKESSSVKRLVNLGDSLDLALWTIEHQERLSPRNNKAYYEAYCL